MAKTVHLPDELRERLAAEAARRGKNVDALVAEIVAKHLPRQRPAEMADDALEAFIGSGTSGRGDLARRHREFGARGPTMTKSPWVVQEVDQATADRLAAAHTTEPLAVELGVDLVADPNREDEDGYVWTRLHAARDVRVIVPGSAVVMGSDVGEWVAKVIAWDFEVSEDDPIVTLEVVPLTPSALAGALARCRPDPLRSTDTR